MAKRKATRRAKTRTIVKKSYSRKKSGKYGADISNVLGSGVYGAFRSRLANMAQPITNKIPFGNIADEVAMGGLAVLLKRTIAKRMPLIKPVLQGAISIESARIGEAIALGQVSMKSSSSNSSVAGIYG